MPRTRVYIASAYTLGDVEANVRASMAAWDRLWKAGYAPLSPLWSHFQDRVFPLPYADWLAYDLEWLPLCHALLRLPDESHGADRETAAAERLGIPVYASIDALLAAEPPTRPDAGPAADIARLRQLDREATPRPWRVAEHKTGHKAILAPHQTGEHGSVAKVFCEIDAELIAAAANALPELLRLAAAAVRGRGGDAR